MPGRVLDTRKRRIFDSVFGGVADLSQPTPVATPAAGFTAPGQAFGAPVPTGLKNNFSSPVSRSLQAPQQSFQSSDPVQDQVRWDRSWHLVTHTLILPEFNGNRAVLGALKPDGDSIEAEFYDSLEVVLFPQASVPYARQTEDLMEWQTGQVRHHFLVQVLPIILQAKKLRTAEEVLYKSTKILETAHRQYLHGLSFIKEQIEVCSPGTSGPVVSKFLRDLHAIISNSVTELLCDSLQWVLKSRVATILGLPSTGELGHESAIRKEGEKSEKARREMLSMVGSIKNIGLGGERFQVIFAEIMNDAMSEYVYVGCKGLWSSSSSSQQQKATDRALLPKAAHNASPSQCVTDLCDWIENRYAKIAVQTLNLLDTKTRVSWVDKEKYKEMGIGRLSELRTNEMFQIVGKWPNATGALDDLRTAITTPQRRLHLTEVFAQTLSDKLLHPGASTLEILQTYISMIRSFHAVDHSKVLLDRVAFPLQLYLCSRDDTVRIIIRGLLSEVRDPSAKLPHIPEEKLYEVAEILNDPSQATGQKFSDGDLDWHDMDWVPDPVDAGPGYKRSKNADIIGTLISVLGSQEVFIKEFQNIIAENMIEAGGAFGSLKKEERVLELLKGRFGEAPLQACEVMMKDIVDSQALNSMIREDLRLISKMPRETGLDPTGASVEQSGLHAKILSRLFWPQLQHDTFRIPEPISTLQRVYEEGFQSQKSHRKLTWLPALGQVVVELELEDRTVKEEVHTWQAVVIYAFHSDDNRVAIQRTTAELVAELEMDESLVRSALAFWVHKLVLYLVSPSTYAVLETLNSEERQRSQNTAVTGGASSSASGSGAPGRASNSDDRAGGSGSHGMGGAKEQLYWKFIQGMLKNGAGGMGVAQMAMRLKMLIAEGFPYGNDELKAFLDGKVQEGKLEMKGGKYKLRK